MWMEDVNKFHTKMRGFIPEYDKLPKISHSSAPPKVSKKPNALDEILQAAEGVPKIPQFF